MELTKKTITDHGVDELSDYEKATGLNESINDQQKRFENDPKEMSVQTRPYRKLSERIRVPTNKIGLSGIELEKFEKAICVHRLDWKAISMQLTGYKKTSD